MHHKKQLQSPKLSCLFNDITDKNSGILNKIQKSVRQNIKLTKSSSDRILSGVQTRIWNYNFQYYIYRGKKYEIKQIFKQTNNMFNRLLREAK